MSTTPRRWAAALRAAGLHEPISLLEIAPGCNGTVLEALEAFNHPETSYTALDANIQLTCTYRNLAADVPTRFSIIEGDARRVCDYVQKESFDAVALEHAINDMILEIIAKKHGIDTVGRSWGEIHPDMTALVREEIERGTLEKSVRSELVGILASCVSALKSRGCLIASHFMQYYNANDGDRYYNYWENLIPTIRQWVNEARIGTEIYIDRFDRQWWMFIQKT